MQNIEEIYNKYARIVYKYIFCMTLDRVLVLSRRDSSRYFSNCSRKDR